MLNKFKEHYYRRGVFACANEAELREAIKAIHANGGSILGEKNLIGKMLIKYMIPEFYRSVAKYTLVFECKNLSTVVKAMQDFQKATDGFVINKQDFVEI